jgi:glycosyltransferase involved in cell wall biosynthesis
MLQVCYLLESTNLSGGVRVIFDQARALRRRGHQVHILALRGDHRWYPYGLDVQYVMSFHTGLPAVPLDVVVATFWTTVEPALRIPARLAVHFCQGCEWSFPEYAPIKDRIEQAYAFPIPKLTTGPWLVAQIQERLGTRRFPVASIGQIVDTHLHRPATRWERLGRRFRRGPQRVLVVGMYEAWVKGIATALDAVAQARSSGLRLRLLRVSTLPLSDQERAHTPIDAYHHRISPVAIARLYRTADVLLAPSRSPEGFGLPLAEALASGLPAVATRIPSFLSFDASSDYAYFVPEGDSSAMAEGLQLVLQDESLRDQLRQRGLEVVREQFSPAAVAERIETSLMRWLAGDLS